jgi:hypothetical protein
VYPENWAALNVFLAMSTQWRTAIVAGAFGGGGVIMVGMEYTAIEPVCRLMGVRKRERADVFARLRVMEEAALAVAAEKRK